MDQIKLFLFKNTFIMLICFKQECWVQILLFSVYFIIFLIGFSIYFGIVTGKDY